MSYAGGKKLGWGNYMYFESSANGAPPSYLNYSLYNTFYNAQYTFYTYAYSITGKSTDINYANNTKRIWRESDCVNRITASVDYFKGANGARGSIPSSTGAFMEYGYNSSGNLMGIRFNQWSSGSIKFKDNVPILSLGTFGVSSFGASKLHFAVIRQDGNWLGTFNFTYNEYSSYSSSTSTSGTWFLKKLKAALGVQSVGQISYLSSADKTMLIHQSNQYFIVILFRIDLHYTGSIKPSHLYFRVNGGDLSCHGVGQTTKSGTGGTYTIPSYYNTNELGNIYPQTLKIYYNGTLAINATELNVKYTYRIDPY